MSAIDEALVAIQREIEPIPKADRNEKQDYDYRSIVRVYNSIQPLLAEHGVYTTAKVVEQEHHQRMQKTRDGDRTISHAIVTMAYTYRCADGSSVTTEAIGEGIDYGGDKASNKAQSIADKYALLQLFKIPYATIDPDADDGQRPPRRPDAPTTPERGQRVTAADLKQLTALFQAKYPDKSAGDFDEMIPELLGEEMAFPRSPKSWTRSQFDRVTEALQ